jgi:hypothetical protein
VQPLQFSFCLRLKCAAWVSVQPLDPSASPISHVEQQRFSYEPLPTLCALPEPSSPLAAILFVCSPIAPFAPTPFSAVRLLTLCESSGLTSRRLLYHSTTQSQKSLGLTFQLLTALGHASLEALEAHSLYSTLLPPRVFDSD